MHEPFRLFPETASRAAGEVNHLSIALLGIATFFSLVIILGMLVLVVHYRHTRVVNRQTSHSKRLHWAIEVSWMLAPLTILLMVFAWGAAVYIRARRPPEQPVEINVVAKQWMWKIAHESGRREINTLHVPTGRPVRLTMISEDVIHSFYVPAFRAKQDVLPGRYTAFWFEALRTGTYHLFCAEYCGTDHSRMVGKIIVQTPEAYASWLESEETESMAQRGRRWLESFGCLRCHGQMEDGPMGDAQAGDGPIGPTLSGLYGQTVILADGTRTVADPAYLRRAILDPKAETRPGYSTVMPSYKDQLEPEQVMEIIAYLRSIADATGPLPGPGPELIENRQRVDLPAETTSRPERAANERGP